MKNYFKKFSIMFVMLLAVIGVGAIQNGTVANAADGDYVLKKDYSANLVANYKFEETIGPTCNISEGTSVGTYHGTESVTGSVGNARSFNGTSDYISFSNQVIPLGKKSIRFKIRTTSTSWSHIFSNSGGFSAKYGTNININSGKITFVLSKSTAGTYNSAVSSDTPINDGNWHDVLITWDGTTTTNAIKIYIDGTLNASGTAISTETNIASYNLYIGKQAGASAYYFNGELDEFEIYDDVLEYEDESITLDKSTLELTEGDSGQLTATTTPSAVGITWTSSDISIATVDSNGKVTSVKEGTCTITATINDESNLSASCAVNVTPKYIPGPNSDTKTGAILIINLTDGETKIFDVTNSEVSKFKQWYNTKTEYENKLTYEFNKTVNSNISVEEDVVHNQITSYEIRKY